MVVGLLKIKLHLFGVGSLKAKRSIIKSVVERVRNRFNFSVAEVESMDSKKLGVIGLVTVSNDSKRVNSQLDKVISFIHGDGRFYVGEIDREIFS